MRENLFRVLATMGALALGSLVASCAGGGPYGANVFPEPGYKEYTPIIGPVLGGDATTLPIPGLKPFVGVGPFVTGNDTGGIIQWTPENDANAVQLAADFCAQYHKYPRLTSIHPRYGDYIGFACEWRPNHYAYGQRVRPSY
ncbi:MAG: hypothetical protein ACLPKB_35860 [Xanthobacteraceae bacterium]